MESFEQKFELILKLQQALERGDYTQIGVLNHMLDPDIAPQPQAVKDEKQEYVAEWLRYDLDQFVSWYEKQYNEAYNQDKLTVSELSEHIMAFKSHQHLGVVFDEAKLHDLFAEEQHLQSAALGRLFKVLKVKKKHLEDPETV